MDDRELLEMAAKAAGFGAMHGTCWTETEYPKRSGKYGALWNYIGNMDTAELWNPLTDDGDALRLAVKLELDLRARSAPVQVVVDAPGGVWIEESGTDKGAATRRAIVRAAAEIGRMR